MYYFTLSDDPALGASSLGGSTLAASKSRGAGVSLRAGVAMGAAGGTSWAVWSWLNLQNGLYNPMSKLPEV